MYIFFSKIIYNEYIEPYILSHVVSKFFSSAPPLPPESHTIDMVCRNLLHGYLMGVDLTQIPANHENLFVVCHVGFKLSSVMICLGPYALTFWCEVNLDNLGLSDQ